MRKHPKSARRELPYTILVPDNIENQAQVFERKLQLKLVW